MQIFSGSNNDDNSRITCSKYQFWIFRALVYLLMIIVYLIIIDLPKEIETDQDMMMLIGNWLSP